MSYSKNEETPRSMNWHCEAVCNYGCSFCFAPFERQRREPRLSESQGIHIVARLAEAGIQKINFVGGEPMLHPHIEAWIIAAKQEGLVTSIVSNGSRMTREWLEDMRFYLDWIGLSIDASNDELHYRMGRGRIGDLRQGRSRHLNHSLEVLEHAILLDYGIKLNTVVTDVNALDDMSHLVELIQPVRWKIFQVLEIEGENQGSVEPLLVDDRQFADYVQRHKAALSGNPEIQIVAEDNDAMICTYAMLDPLGRVYTNAGGRYNYSTHTLLETDFASAWADVSAGFDAGAFEKREGSWDWNRQRTAQPSQGFSLPQYSTQEDGV
jgi:radical S-adenosyl methionine domain-containing protein 2